MRILLTIFVLSSVVSFFSYALYQAEPHNADIEDVFGWSTVAAIVSGVTAALVFIWS